MTNHALTAAFLLLAAFPAAAGSKVRIDASTEEALDASISAMRSDLSNKEKCLLSAAFLRLQIADKADQAARTGDPDAAPGELGPKIDGLTYKEIVKKSEKVDAPLVSLCRE